MALGKHAGRAGVEAALEEHDVETTDDQLDEIVSRVKEIGDRGKRVTDADLLTIADEVTGQEQDRRVELLGLTAVSGSDTPTASVRLSVAGEERKAAAVGSGPVDAAMNATEDALSHTANATLEDYHVDAITGGTDAIVTVEIEMSRGDDTVAVSASDSDITRASVRSMVDAMDRLVANDDGQLVADD